MNLFRSKMTILLTFLALTLVVDNGFGQKGQTIEIALLGTFHFQQFHKDGDASLDFFGFERQKEIEEVIDKLKSYRPDQIYIEREPRYQMEIDSLYDLFKEDKLNLSELENGAGEVYQLAFRLAKSLDLGAPKCVNHYESTSQGLLASGTHIEKYQEALKEFQNLGRSVVGNFLQGKTSLLETLIEMNRPKNVTLSYQLLFNIPAYVKDGKFSSYEGIGEEPVDNRYIGAEFISLFYERNLKIYSNILNTQLKQNDKRILFITGQVHVGVLQTLLDTNPNYSVKEAAQVLTQIE